VGIGFILRRNEHISTPDFVALWLVYYLMLTLLWPLLLQQQHQVIKRAHQIVLKSIILNKVLDNPCNDMYAYLFGNVNIQRREPRKDAAV
jgi:surface polysaccharide O-acyltransferase-like enzyme